MSTHATDPSSSLLPEQQAMQTLLQLLQQEQEKLIDASIDGLNALMRAKAESIEQLTILAKSRYASLTLAGFAASESGMGAWLAASAAPDAETQWHALLALSAEAKELNRINGMLIGRHLVRNQTELNILQGKPQNGNLYGPNGQSTGKSFGRGLVIG